MDQLYDVVVVGGGPGGYVAALEASRQGLRCALVEKENLGGVCLNWGCIPTKALLSSAHLYHTLRHADTYGLKVSEISFDMEAIVKRSRLIVEKLKKGLSFLTQKKNLNVLQGRARLLSGTQPFSVAIEGHKTSLKAKHVILATGSRPRLLPKMPSGVWTAKEAMTPSTCPQSLIIVGSGAIGLEFACFYQALGCKVNVIEAAETILPGEDFEVSAAAHDVLSQRGITFVVGAKVQAVEDTPQGFSVRYDQHGKNEVIKAQKVLMAIGIVPNLDNIGLDAFDVAYNDRGFLVTSDTFQTQVPGLYALGDITQAPWLAHKASAEGVRCLRHIKGEILEPLAPESIPRCTYTFPQIASVGLTEYQAKEAGYKLKIGKSTFQNNGQALCGGESDGFVKVIFDEATGEFLGAHMIGPYVSELIHSVVVGRTAEATEQQWLESVAPHPSLSEVLFEAISGAYGCSLHGGSAHSG